MGGKIYRRERFLKKSGGLYLVIPPVLILLKSPEAK
jgi:hypothetical protein